MLYISPPLGWTGGWVELREDLVEERQLLRYQEVLETRAELILPAKATARAWLVCSVK